MLIDVRLEVLHLTIAIVLGRTIALASRDEEDRWVATNLKLARDEVSSGINLSEANLAAIDVVLLGELLPGRKKSLAVTAPWSIASNEGISLSLGDLLIEGLANDDINLTRGSSSRNVLALDVLLGLAVNKLLSKGLDLLLVESLELTLVKLLTVDDGNLELLVAVQVHLMEVVVTAISGNKVKLALELTSNRTKTVKDVTKTSGVVLSADLAVDNEHRKRAIADTSVLVIDTSKRDRDFLDPLADGFSVVLAAVDNLLLLTLAKVAESNDLILVLSGGGSDTKDVVLTESVCSRGIRLAKLGVSSGVGDELDILTALDELLDSFLVLEGLGSRTSLCTHVLDDAVGFTRTVVFSLLTLVENVKSGVTVNSETISKLSLYSAIDLTEDNTLRLEDSSSLDEFRSKVLAVTTPWCIELNEHGFSFVDNLIKVVLGKNNNLAVLLS